MQPEKLSSTTTAAATNHQSQNALEIRQQPNRERTTEEKGELIRGGRSSQTNIRTTSDKIDFAKAPNEHL
jgi:hypothetical protein